MPAWLQHDWCSSFVLTLGHFLWQGTLIALALAIALRAVKTVSMRYWLSLAALLVMATCPIVTLGWLMQPVSHVATLDNPPIVRDEPSPSSPMTAAVPFEEPSDVEHVSNVPLMQPVAPIEVGTAITIPPQVPTDNQSWWQRFAPQLTTAYLCGVALMLLRLVFGLWGGRRLRRRVHLIDDSSLLGAMRRQATALGLKLLPVLAYCERVTVPTVVGVLKPMILLPLTLTSGLSPEQMESVLAHELAHLRRYDHLVNLLQRVIESLLFFHPALWWVSHRIRDEREHCCDDLVVACGAMPLDYAKSLLVVAELSRRGRETRAELGRSVAAVSLLATGPQKPSNLRQRIARLLGESATPSLRVSPRALLLAIGIPVVAVIATIQSGASPPSPSLKLDVETRAGSESPRAGRGSPDPALDPTAGLPNSDEETNPPNSANGDLRSNPAAGSGDPSRAQPEKPGADVESRLFRLKVVGPDGRPVAKANVEFRGRPGVSAEQIRRGAFVEKHQYGLIATANEQGELFVDQPREVKSFQVFVTQSGFGPFCAQWDGEVNPRLVLPEEFTAQLDAAWSVGGIVVDESGAPIVDARVHPSLEYKKPPGDRRQLGVGTVIRTDAKGAWRYDSVPITQKNEDYVHVSINHPNFQPLRRPLKRVEFEIKGEAGPAGRIEMKQGVIVTGTVTDSAGKPVENALVRSKFINEVREARTDANGVYRLGGCEPIEARIVVSAKGLAVEMREVRVEAEMKPVDFSLKAGGHVRVRVVDAAGRGIPKARIFFQRWRGRFQYFEFDHRSQYTDQEGIWEWNEAPLDEFQADICHPDGMQLPSQPLIARTEEYVFKPASALIVSGRVVDAKTKQPVAKFKVTPGMRVDWDEERHWDWRESFDASGGKYQIRFDGDEPAHLVRIEASGYRTALSRDIKPDEGRIDINFELEPAEDIAATVVTTFGIPAFGAKIAVGLAGSQISIKNGEFVDHSTFAARLETDLVGNFRLSARDEPFQLVILHPEGFAYLKSTDGPIPKVVKLTAWARVEGTLRIGKSPAADVNLLLNSEGIHSYGKDVPRISCRYETKTGAAGRYVFDRAFPGRGRIGREVNWKISPTESATTSSHQVTVELAAGKTSQLDLGGTGRTVIGQLAAPAGAAEPIQWTMAQVELTPDLLEPPLPANMIGAAADPARKPQWDEWLKSAAGRAWNTAFTAYLAEQEKSSRYLANVAPDGSFQIDDVPDGKYVLTVRFHRDSPGDFPARRVTVPAAGDEPVKLGGVARPESSKGVGEKDGDKTSTPFAKAQGVPPDPARMRVHDARGSKALFNDVVKATVGFPKASPDVWLRSPNREGMVSLDGLPVGTQWLLAAGNSPQRLPFQITIPTEQPLLERRLRHPAWLGKKVELAVQPVVEVAEQAGEVIVIEILNRSNELLSFSEADLVLSCELPSEKVRGREWIRGLSPKWLTADREPFPQTKIEAGQTGRMRLNWREWVRQGLWSSRNHETIAEPGFPPNEPGKIWVKAGLGNGGSLPVSVTDPKAILPKEVVANVPDADAETSLPKGLEFLKPYPKLHGLSLDMTEPQFLEIIKQQELKTKKTGEEDKTAYHMGLGDGLTLIVMFHKDATCRGIQRIRGEDEAPQPLATELPDGVRIELHGVENAAQKTPAAWKPDGTKLERPKEWPELLEVRDQNPTHGFVFRVTGLAKGQHLTWRLPGQWASPDQSKKLPEFLSVSTREPEAKTADVRVGVTHAEWGPWQRVEVDGTIKERVAVTAPFRAVYEKVKPHVHASNADGLLKSGLELEGISGIDDHIEYEAVIVNKGGTRHERRGIGASRNGTIPYFDVPKDRIGHLEYRLRPYQHWVTFENVSLLPGQMTNVKVKVESLPAVAKFPPPNREAVRGLDLSRVAVRGYREALRQTPDLYVLDPRTPDSWTRPKNVFPMPLAEHTWLKFPAGSGHFYIEHRSDGSPESEQIYGPIDGDPFDVLKLDEFLREKLKPKDNTVGSDPRYRLRLMFRTGDPGLMRRAWSLVEPHLAHKFEDRNERGLFERLEMLEIVREALRNEAAAFLKPEMSELAARMRAAVSAAEASIDALNDAVSDESYQSATYLQAKIAAKLPDALWGKPVSGLRLGLVPRDWEPNIDWYALPANASLPTSITAKPGQELGYQLIVENVSDHEIKLSGYVAGEEMARSVEVLDRNGQPAQFDSLHTSIPHFRSHWRLKPGERKLLMMPAVYFEPASLDPPGKGLGYHVHAESGRYSLRFSIRFGDLDNERHRHVVGQSEWIGKLTTGTQTITVGN